MPTFHERPGRIRTSAKFLGAALAWSAFVGLAPQLTATTSASTLTSPARVVASSNVAPSPPLGEGPPVSAPSPLYLRTPVRLWVPALSLSTPLVTLGLNANGTVQVPRSAFRPGWYRLGPSPGQMGSAVILGHLDSDSGPGVFYNLRTLRPGDEITVAAASGLRVHFRVTAVRQYTKSSFPAQLVYGNHGARQLQLVTCGGKFNFAKGHYESNVVVFSTEI